MDTATLISELALEDYHRITQRFIQEAIRVWDTSGSGCFAYFIKLMVERMWRELIICN